MGGLFVGRNERKGSSCSNRNERKENTDTNA